MGATIRREWGAAAAVLSALAWGGGEAPAVDPAAAKVLDAAAEAAGSKEAWARIRTSVVERKGLMARFVESRKAPGLFRRSMGTVAACGFDGKEAWAWDERSGVQAVELDPAPPPWLRDGSGWREEVASCRLAGREALDGAAADRVEIVLKDGRRQTRWYDAKSRLLRQVMEAEDLEAMRFEGEEIPARTVESFTRLEGYREVEGVRIPFRILGAGRIAGSPEGERLEWAAEEILSVRLNVELDDRLFRKPSKGERPWAPAEAEDGK